MAGGLAVNGTVNDLAMAGARPMVMSTAFILEEGTALSEIAHVAQGDTVVHLYPSQLQQLEVALPAEEEQSKIASCLSSLDCQIIAEVENLNALKTHKKGLMQQLFPSPSEVEG